MQAVAVQGGEVAGGCVARSVRVQGGGRLTGGALGAHAPLQELTACTTDRKGCTHTQQQQRSLDLDPRERAMLAHRSAVRGCNAATLHAATARLALRSRAVRRVQARVPLPRAVGSRRLSCAASQQEEASAPAVSGAVSLAAQALAKVR